MLLLRIRVFVLLLPEPCDDVLHDTKGTYHGTVDTSKQECEGYDKQQCSDVEGKQCRQELYPRHPSQVGVCRTGEVHQQPRDECPKDDGESDSDLSKHRK